MQTFLFLDHQGKGRAFADALLEAGYGATESHNAPFDFILSDTDIPARVKGFERAFQLQGRQTPVFLYPHAARPWVAGDGFFQTWPGTTAVFVGTPEHVMIMQAYGYQKPLHPIGWSFSPQFPFTPAKSVDRVLFAPIHPNYNGWLSDVDKSLNERAFSKLLQLRVSGKIRALHVRHIQSLERNGIWLDRRVRYIEGHPDGSCAENDKVDVVVAHQTYAYISIARGKPTVMFGEDVAPHCGNMPAVFKFVASWEKYADMLRFPLDLLDGDPLEVLTQSASANPLVADWRARLIGDQFQPGKFVSIVKSYLDERSSTL